MSQKECFFLPGKIKGDLYRLLNPNMATKMLCHPPHLREKGLMLKTMFLIKKRLMYFLKLLYAVQNLKIVSMYIILPKNK